MSFYSGYTHQSTLKEKAIVFFTLLNEMYKIQAQEKLELINITIVPHIKKSDAQKIINGYRYATGDIVELLQETHERGDIDKLKRVL